MSDIFISYNNHDKEKAKLFATTFERQGWSVFWDKNIPPGKTFDEYINEQLEAAKCVIVLWSKTSIASDWVKEEAQRGAARKILVPVFIERVMPPLGFGRIEAAELFDWEGDTSEAEFQNLLKAIELIAGENKPAYKQPPEPATPRTEGHKTGHVPGPSRSVPIDQPSPRKSRKYLIPGLASLAVLIALALAWQQWGDTFQSGPFPKNRWGVVFGSDVSLSEAINEINQRTSDDGIPKDKTRIFLRNGYYASIALVESEAEADQYLSIAKTFGTGAYKAKMRDWCINPRKRKGFVECLGNQTTD